MITLNCKMSIWITVEMFPICFWRLVCCNISIGRYSVHLRSLYQVMQQLFCLVFCQWKLRKKRKKKKSRSQLVLSWFRLLRVRKKNAFSTENSGDVMSWSHARDRDHAATVLAGGMTIRMDGWPRFTSPPGWVPYCSGCPVTEKTKKSRRCPRSSREIPIQRKTPESRKQRTRILL